MHSSRWKQKRFSTARCKKFCCRLANRQCVHWLLHMFDLRAVLGRLFDCSSLVHWSGQIARTKGPIRPCLKAVLRTLLRSFTVHPDHMKRLCEQQQMKHRDSYCWGYLSKWTPTVRNFLALNFCSKGSKLSEEAWAEVENASLKKPLNSGC